MSENPFEQYLADSNPDSPLHRRQQAMIRLALIFRTSMEPSDISMGCRIEYLLRLHNIAYEYNSDYRSSLSNYLDGKVLSRVYRQLSTLYE